MKRICYALSLFITIAMINLMPICKSQKSLEAICSVLIPENYKIYQPPYNEGNPVDVYVAFQVLDIGEINEEKMDFRLHTFVVMIWNDTRLFLDQYHNRTVIIYSPCRRLIWTPDIFFETAKHVEMFEDTSPSTLFKVLDDGALCMSTRYSFKASCNMNLKNYPFDIQRCHFFLALMSSADSVAKLRWSGSPESPYKELFPSINIVRDSEPLQFYLKKPAIDSVTDDFTTGNYTSLIAIFTLVRRLTGSIVNTYAPSTMIVTMSWVSFWLNVDAVPARVALSVTSLLTLCTQADQYKSQMPPVNYIKAMDIWLFICILMVFATLLEFALSYNLHSKKCSKCLQMLVSEKSSAQHKHNSPLIKMPKVNPWLNENKKKIKIVLTTVQESRLDDNRNTNNDNCKKCKSYKDLGVRIDMISRKFFPGFFLIFAIFYWVYYLRIYNINA